MASHYQTTATIPSELLDVVRAARRLLERIEARQHYQASLEEIQLRTALAKLDALS